MVFGLHVSIAGGLSKAIEEGAQKRCDVIQIFAGNPRGFSANYPSKEEIIRFQKALKASIIKSVWIHAPYLVNLAGSNERLLRLSKALLIRDLEVGKKIGARGVIVHIGNRLKLSVDEAIKKVAAAILDVRRKAKSTIPLCLETTAGSGTSIGSDFGELGAIIRATKLKPDRIGVCIDTQHVFAAGYNDTTKEGIDKVLKEFDHAIGMPYLKVLHMNDSKSDRGSHVDRHEHIGKGKLGLAAFRAIVNHPVLSKYDAILETPWEKDGDDVGNLRVIRSLEKKLHTEL
ncbi:MAG: deoxyribonuclease IV [Parcubacteria group bacterium]|nr:deoxyribonuclease IV [Parcubacteria group bacterium]